MRLVPVLALLTSALSLAACGAGGGAGGGLLNANTLANGVGGCPITPVDNNPNNDCNATGGGTPVVVPTPLPDADGDGIPDKNDTDGSIGSGAGGNNTRIVAGNRAIVLSQFIYDAPTTANAALAQTLVPATSAQAYTDGLILSGAPPATLIHYVDTKSKINTEFATPVVQRQYTFGTRDIDWIGLGHHTFNLGTLAPTPMGGIIGTSGGIPVSYMGHPILFDTLGNQNVVFDPIDKKYKTAVRNTNPDPDNDPDTPMPDWVWGTAIDHSSDHYWNQVKGFMDARANGGTGQNYREYRALAPTEGRDELLQVWAFDNSYAAQYQNAAGGGIPKHQVWSFGGEKATAVPTVGNANYAGRWVGSAQSKDWSKPQDAGIDPNALWRVQGNSKFTADFATGNIRGTLTPESWTSFQDGYGAYTWFTEDSGLKRNGTALEPDYSIIYDTKINITANAAQLTTPLGTTRGPDFTGEANLSGAYITGDNPVYGGFFGTTGSEITGVFNAAGVYPNPQGGSQGINDNRRGSLTINGAFNSQYVAPCVPNVTCVP
jgi:hypothetical protein